MNKREIVENYIREETLFRGVDNIISGRVAWLIARECGVIPLDSGYEDSWAIVKGVFPNAEFDGYMKIPYYN